MKQARHELSRIGAGKAVATRSTMNRWLEYGEPKRYKLSMAFAWVEDVELELLGRGHENQSKNRRLGRALTPTSAPSRCFALPLKSGVITDS